MTRERMASSLARPPALRITCASPSARPANLAGSMRASIQVSTAKRRAGGRASLPLSPNLLLCRLLASMISFRTVLMDRVSSGLGQASPLGRDAKVKQLDLLGRRKILEREINAPLQPAKCGPGPVAHAESQRQAAYPVLSWRRLQRPASRGEHFLCCGERPAGQTPRPRPDPSW